MRKQKIYVDFTIFSISIISIIMSMVKPMKFNLSQENSKRVLSSTKWIANASQNYLSTKPTSSWKKLINAVLLVPIIVPTAATVAAVVCTYFFLNAVSARENDSKLSKTAKFTARILVYVVAAIILIPCIMSNLVTSLIPALVFYCLNRDILNQKNTSEEVDKSEQQSDAESATEAAGFSLRCSLVKEGGIDVSICDNRIRS